MNQGGGEEHRVGVDEELRPALSLPAWVLLETDAVALRRDHRHPAVGDASARVRIEGFLELLKVREPDLVVIVEKGRRARCPDAPSRDSPCSRNRFDEVGPSARSTPVLLISIFVDPSRLSRSATIVSTSAVSLASTTTWITWTGRVWASTVQEEAFQFRSIPDRGNHNAQGQWTRHTLLSRQRSLRDTRCWLKSPFWLWWSSVEVDGGDDGPVLGVAGAASDWAPRLALDAML